MYSKWELKRNDVEAISYSDYGVAIKAMRVALQSPVDMMSDETLMAVCLLGFYEVSCRCENTRVLLYFQVFEIFGRIY